MTEGLQRLEFGRDSILLRALYRSGAKDSPNPGTKARRREVRALSVEGLTAAQQTLEDDVEDLGTSGFTMREDTILCINEGDEDMNIHKKRAPTTKGARLDGDPGSHDRAECGRHTRTTEESRPEERKRWENYSTARQEADSIERQLGHAMSYGLMKPPELDPNFGGSPAAIRG